MQNIYICISSTARNDYKGRVLSHEGYCKDHCYKVLGLGLLYVIIMSYPAYSSSFVRHAMPLLENSGAPNIPTLTFGQSGMEEWGTIITTITTILPFPTNQR